MERETGRLILTTKVTREGFLSSDVGKNLENVVIDLCLDKTRFDDVC